MKNRILVHMCRVIPLIIGMALLFSCKKDIQRVGSLENPDTIPTIRALGVETIYSDSAFVRLRLSAPEMKEFPQADSADPKIEFPQGLTATFFNKGIQIESTLQADYAIYHTKTKAFEARHNVVVKNFTEDQELRTEELWWDEAREKIWSNKSVTITTADGTTIGEGGFEADQNFTRYRIRKTRGQMKVKEELADEQ
jgi:LPS export ABC transporter protein LptC